MPIIAFDFKLNAWWIPLLVDLDISCSRHGIPSIRDGCGPVSVAITDYAANWHEISSYNEREMVESNSKRVT